MTLDEVQSELAAMLNRNGIEAISAWPEGRRTDSDGPVVLVSLEKLTCVPTGMQDYLGQRLDEDTGQWQDVHGRRAQLTFALDILAQPHVGAQPCRQVLDRLACCVQMENPTGLSFRELSGEEQKYDEKEGLMRLRCRLKYEGWLCTAGDEAGTFLDFTLRGDVNV